MFRDSGRGKGVEITQRERLGGGGRRIGSRDREERPRNRRQESTNWEEGGETKAEQGEKETRLDWVGRR